MNFMTSYIRILINGEVIRKVSVKLCGFINKLIMNENSFY
jgi:hypothetical protein